MSSIKNKYTFEYCTKKDVIKFDIIIKLSVDFKFFYSCDELPEDLRNLPTAPYGKRQYFDSFGELKNQITDLIAEYEVTLVDEVKTKVILYSVDFHERVNSIDFKYDVVQKITQQRIGRHDEVNYYTEAKQRDHYGTNTGTRLDPFNATHRLGDDIKEMEWTREREAFFISMDRAIARVQDLIKDGLGSKAQILAKKIDHGGRFLLTGDQDE